MGVKVQMDGFFRVQKELEYMQSHGVKVGVLGDGTSEGGKSVQEYAIYVEYGTVHIPRRPFFRKEMITARAQKEISEYMDKMTGLVCDGKFTGAQFWDAVGLFCKARIIKSISNGSWAANAPSTLERKSGSKPLIDTGTLVDSIDFEVI